MGRAPHPAGEWEDVVVSQVVDRAPHAAPFGAREASLAAPTLVDGEEAASEAAPSVWGMLASACPSSIERTRLHEAPIHG